MYFIHLKYSVGFTEPASTLWRVGNKSVRRGFSKKAQNFIAFFVQPTFYNILWHYQTLPYLKKNLIFSNPTIYSSKVERSEENKILKLSFSVQV